MLPDLGMPDKFGYEEDAMEKKGEIMKTLNLLAMDFGASNGRGLLGRFDGKRLRMEELHRFSNQYIWVNGCLYWNSFYLYEQICESIKTYAIACGPTLDGIGVDTWGVDYGLIDKNGQIIGMPFSYRMSNDETMDEVWDIVSKREIFERTGLAANNFNTIFQLYARKKRGDVALESAKHLLLLPDLFEYMLSGEVGSEYTMAMTTQLCDAKTKQWDKELLGKLSIRDDIFIPVSASCSKRGNLLSQIAKDCGVNQAPVLAVGSHDTASAVAAVPGKGNFVYISSGTWSLFGMESDQAIINDAVYEANYSNEGTVQGGFRPLKNIMGLWLIQQLRREWQRKGKNLSWDEIVDRAKAAEPFRSIVDPDYQGFFSTDEMGTEIAEYCKKTGQSAPGHVSEYARCVYESLALKYRWALEKIEEIRGSRVDALHIVGGGCQNKLLNQMTANAIGRPVIAGPIEGASIGNLLGQAMALGEISGIDQLREVVRNSFEVEEYLPEDMAQWDDAYGRFLDIVQKAK